ncbi:uncharacterized protein [Dermacentor andersoni]|uniref:uncharacterized protein isoform X2 n=1 Tax=Dermacentor andersoni TaxID=34620 RepID=UPI002417AB25|nr:uncharacterized protein LOC126539808 isoform X2 [Dermacentor andersoni]
MEAVMDSVGLMSEVDQLFHARNPLFILRQFLGVTCNRMRLLRERNTLLSSLLYNLRFIMNVLFVKDSFGLVFMMTFLMRDVDELFHGVQALFMFLTFTVRKPHSNWVPLAKFFLFQFHFRLVTHRHSAAPGRKYVFAMDVAYHAFEWCLFFVSVTKWPPPPLSPVLVLAQSFQALALLYHTYVIWTFVRWIKLTLPIVQQVSAQPEDGAGHLLSPAMSRLLMSLLEAQGGNVPLLRLLERVLRLQERVRNLAQILENQQLHVGDAGAAGAGVAPVVAAAAAGQQQQLLNVLRAGPRRSAVSPVGASGLDAQRERAADRPSGVGADDRREGRPEPSEPAGPPRGARSRPPT